jgi:hypothetical protein
MSKRFRLGTIGIVTTVLGAGISLAGVAVPALAGTPTTGTAPGARVAVEDPSGDDTDAPPMLRNCPPPLSVEVTDITETGGVFHFTIDPTAADYTRIAPMIGNLPFDDIIPDGVTASYTIPFDIFQPGSRGLQAAVTMYCTDAERPGRDVVDFDLLGDVPANTAAAMATSATSGTAQAAATAAGTATAGANAAGTTTGENSDDARGDNAGSVSAAATLEGDASSTGTGASGATSGAVDDSSTAAAGTAAAAENASGTATGTGGDSATGSAEGASASAGNSETETGTDVPVVSNPVTDIQPVTGLPDTVSSQAGSDTALAATGTDEAVPALFGGLVLAVGGFVLALVGFRRTRTRLSNQQQ